MEVIWSLLLTVCGELHCVNQTIQWFEEKPQCMEMKQLHEELPQDGNWKTVEYNCTIVGSRQV
tara:strand:- start:8391 stop:8579 length:189 start_codon:yes stop_codon:yes gene_type:complete